MIAGDARDDRDLLGTGWVPGVTRLGLTLVGARQAGGGGATARRCAVRGVIEASAIIEASAVGIDVGVIDPGADVVSVAGGVVVIDSAFAGRCRGGGDVVVRA